MIRETVKPQNLRKNGVNRWSQDVKRSISITVKSSIVQLIAFKILKKLQIKL